MTIPKTTYLLFFAFSVVYGYRYAHAQGEAAVFALNGKYNTYRDYSPIDISPIIASIKDKRIVGFGESSHGTMDFYAFNSFLAKSLMEQNYCKSIILEKPFDQCMEINEYINGRDFDFKKLMNDNGLTLPVRELIQWMRNYNTTAAPEDKLFFLGMDVNGDNRTGIRMLNAELTKSGQPIYMEADSLVKKFSRRTDTLLENYIQFTEACFKTDKIKKKIDTYRYKLLMGILNNLKLSLDFQRASPLNFTKKRDEGMSQNVKFLEENIIPGSTLIFLWAHNGHIRKEGKSMLFRPVGSYLKQFYKEGYASVALDFAVGSLYVGGEATKVMDSDNSNKKFAGQILGNKHEGITFVAFKAANNAYRISWPKRFDLHIYDLKKKMDKYTTDDFDGLIFFSKITSIYDYKNSVYDK